MDVLEIIIAQRILDRNSFTVQNNDDTMDGDSVVVLYFDNLRDKPVCPSWQRNVPETVAVNSTYYV